jgi:hypothetical protein
MVGRLPEPPIVQGAGPLIQYVLLRLHCIYCEEYFVFPANGEVTPTTVHAPSRCVWCMPSGGNPYSSRNIIAITFEAEVECCKTSTHI